MSTFWKVRSYTPWEAGEEEALRLGVRKYGLGAWQGILQDPEFGVLQGRNGIQLKDKWRNLVKFKHVSREEADHALKTASRAGGVSKKVSNKRSTRRPTWAQLGAKPQKTSGDNSSESDQVAMAITDAADTRTNAGLRNGLRFESNSESQATTSEVAEGEKVDYEVQSRCSSLLADAKARDSDVVRLGRWSVTGGGNEGWLGASCSAEAQTRLGGAAAHRRQESCCESYVPAMTAQDAAMGRVAVATDLAREAHDIQLEANRQLSAVIEAMDRGVVGMSVYMKNAMEVAQTASERAMLAYQKLHEANAEAFGQSSPSVAATNSTGVAGQAPQSDDSDDSCESEEEMAAAEALIIALRGETHRAAKSVPSESAEGEVRLCISSDEVHRWALAVEAAKRRKQRS